MEFSALFEKTLALWTSVVSISDGQLIDETNASFPCITSAWERAEEAAEQLSEWQQLMVWAIFGGLHRKARSAFERGETAIEVAMVDRVYVERKFSENLFSKTEPGYPEEMKSAYKNDLQP